MELSKVLKTSIPQLTGSFEEFKKATDELLKLAKTEKEKKMITDFIADAINADTEQLVIETKILLLKVQLLENEDIIPYSYIAKKYFNKSKGWLSQRMNGYNTNRKRAKFTPVELETLNFAIQDISKKLGSITL